MLYFQAMQRRPFLQKVGALSAGLISLPFLSYSTSQLPKATRLKFITASDGHWGQPNTDFALSHQNLIDAIHREKGVDLSNYSTATYTSYQNKSTANKIFLGYKYSKESSIELYYAQLGTSNYSINATA